MIPSTAARKAASFVFDGLLKPLTFRTNCREAARISSSVTGGEKLKRILIFRHMSDALNVLGRLAKQANRPAAPTLAKLKPRTGPSGSAQGLGVIHALCARRRMGKA